MKETVKKHIDTSKIIILFIVIILIIIDQLSKIFVYNVEEINIFNGIIKISLNEEKNESSILTYVMQNIIVLGIIIKFLMSKNEFIEEKTKVFLSLVLAGGIANFIDRIIRGCVITFININIGKFNLPTLNIAYICIIIGMLFIIGNFTKFTVKEMRSKKSGKIHS